MLRIDRETKKDISQQTFNRIIQNAEKIIPDVDLILISDYGKGLINRPMIKKLVQIAKKHNKTMKYQKLENQEANWKWIYLIRKHREGEKITQNY